MNTNGKERNHKRTVIAYRKGNDYRWVACLAASRIVGQYEKGASQAVADDLCISLMQVTNLARAGDTYKYLRPYFTRFKVDFKPVREKLTPSHFQVMGDLVRKYDISPLEQIEQLRTAAENGVSVIEMKREIINEQRGNGTPPLPEGKFDLIYADPPWKYSNSGFDEAAEQQYPTMPIEDICAMKVGDLATDESVLFMWATNPLLPEALQVIDAWGFEYKTNLAWVKDRGRGKGWFSKSRHELLMIGTRNNTPHPVARYDSCFFADRDPKHSKKPNRAYEIIEAMYPLTKKIELFARDERNGWEVWGNEL